VSERRRRQTESTVHSFTRLRADFEPAFRTSFNENKSQTQVRASVMDSTGSESGPAVGSSEHGTQPLVHHNTVHFLTRLTLRLLMSYIYIYMERIFLMFLDHTQRRTTVGRTPLDE